MLKRCTAFLLLLAFAAMTFSRAVILVDFYANQDYIAKNLCENRDKPQMHCCGKCLLRKRLAHEDNQDKNNPERKSDDRNEVLFFEESSVVLAPPFVSLISSPIHPVVSGTPVDRTFPFFHPPGC